MNFIWQVLTFKKFKSTWFLSLISWVMIIGAGYAIWAIWYMSTGHSL